MPGSATDPMVPVMKRYGQALLILLMAGAAIILVGTIASLLSMAFDFLADRLMDRLGYEEPIPAGSFLKFLLSLPFLAAATVVYLYPGRKNGGLDYQNGLLLPREISPPPASWMAILLALFFLLPVGAQSVASILETLSFRLNPDREAYMRMMDILGPTGHWIDFAGAIWTIGIVGPICEEFIFRGFMLRSLLRSGSNVHVAIVFQALLFGIIHGNPFQFSYAWPLGVLFGYMTVYSGYRFSSVILHSTTNLFAVFAMYGFIPLLPSDPQPGDFLPQWFLVGGSCLLATGLGLYFIGMPNAFGQTLQRIRASRTQSPAGTEGEDSFSLDSSNPERNAGIREDSF